MPLTDEQIDQYSRQIILPELGGIGQRRLLSSRALLLGDGPALECAATYLAGAGLGSLELQNRDRVTAFARLTERCGDVSLGAAPAVPDLGAYDVFLDFPAAPGTAVPVRGQARLGEARVRCGLGEVLLDVVPQPAGCAMCRAPEEPTSGTIAPEVDLLQAGAMAALVALLWTAEISTDLDAKRLVLATDAPTWSESVLGPTASCPRPCRR